MEHVHTVVRADISKGKQLILWQLAHCKVAEVENGYPLVNMAWQEHNTFYVLPQEDETFLEYLV